MQYNHGNEQRDGWIGIEAIRRIGQPNDERGYDDSNIAQRIPSNMQNHCAHAHIRVVVSAMTLSCLLWLLVIVVLMPRAVSSTTIAISMCVAMNMTMIVVVRIAM